MSVQGPDAMSRRRSRKRAIEDVDGFENSAIIKRPTINATNEPIATADDRGIILPFQRQLQIHKVGGEYELAEVPIPEFRYEGEILLEVLSIGLNPIDWKAPAYGFGIPSFPCVYGREFIGRVAAKRDESGHDSLDIGDVVLSISTDYRDYRKAGFQEFAVALSSNVVRVPKNVSSHQVSGIGVAFAAAILSLGICLGLRFPLMGQDSELDLLCELDLLLLARCQPKFSVPEDVREEVFWSITSGERASKGDWIVIMGASAISGQMAVQLAKLGGMRVIAVADSTKYEQRLLQLGADVVVDRHDLARAQQTIRRVTKGFVRFALDAVGQETSTWCQTVLSGPSLRSFSGLDSPMRGHLIGLSGTPKKPLDHVKCHKLPIKLFHENAVIGRAVVSWLHELLATNTLQLPEVDVVDGGLESVNYALGKVRRGEAAGKRVVVNLK